MARACGERLSFLSRATRAYSALRTVSSAVLQKMYENEAHVQCHVGHFDWISVLSLAILIEFCGNHGKVFCLIYHRNNIRGHLNIHLWYLWAIWFVLVACCVCIVLPCSRDQVFWLSFTSKVSLILFFNLSLFVCIFVESIAVEVRRKGRWFILCIVL